MQLGFVIDHAKCIGCHACTVACKSENEVPLGDFRTWVKYTEEGSFPQVKRSFAVLRCNQCTDAPCVTICPVNALEKAGNGIVDVDPAICIGCKACMQGCPYDALYLNEHTGTAQKCHLCAHRVEVGLAPACVVVCPTEALIPGDFHDPNSEVSRLRKEHDLKVRKPEAGTGPNVFYRDAHPAGLDPLLTDGSTGYLWSQQRAPEQVAAERARTAQAPTASRTSYDVDHTVHWGNKVSGYLLTKSVASGAAMLAAADHLLGGGTLVTALLVVSLIFLTLTAGLLLADLKRPERFWRLLLKPNWNSWLARGSFIITGFGLLLVAALVMQLTQTLHGVPGAMVMGLLVPGGFLTAAYTGWLFGQAKGRPLWMQRGLWLHLTFQAMVGGGAAGLLAAAFTGIDIPRGVLVFLDFGLAGHVLFMLIEDFLAPRGRAREFKAATHLLNHGPYARRHWLLGFTLGAVIPAALLWVVSAPLLLAALGVLLLVGLYVEEDLLVRAGQALPIS